MQKFLQQWGVSQSSFKQHVACFGGVSIGSILAAGYSFGKTPDQLELFFSVCKEINADTEDKRLAILRAMAELGHIDGITKTNKTKEDYIKHISEKFGKILVVKSKENQ